MKSPSPAKPVEHRIVAAPIAAPQSTFLGASSFFGIDFVTPTSVSKHFASGLPLRQLEHSSEDNALVYEIVCPEKHITRRFYVALAAQAAKAIAEMPLLRPIEWRGQQDLLNIRTVNKGSPSNAAVIYTRGSESSTPCSRCQRGLGPFVRCITAQGPRGEVVGFGACSSCIWSAQPHLCTLRDDREYLASKNETHRARSLSLKKAPKPTRVPSKSSTRSFPTLKAFMKEIAPYQDDPKVIRAARDAVRGALTTLNKCLATLEAASRKDLAEDELSSDGWNEFR
ncbi:hypothetical protein PRK78_007475 [Emydomyces testavorans]|uniref:Uncharacterized protein n=1 Tax=Emydomyces testavorans TaxID=2070801 RepID=A0AAF0ILG2_9EURO|nr:hypothetical protein PRK78_007475 [Emydomyces testavorans]